VAYHLGPIVGVMKPYGRDQEPRNTRDCADVADCANLGLPSRAHRLTSHTRKTSRRRWARAERQASRERLRAHH